MNEMMMHGRFAAKEQGTNLPQFGCSVPNSIPILVRSFWNRLCFTENTNRTDFSLYSTV